MTISKLLLSSTLLLSGLSLASSSNVPTEADSKYIPNFIENNVTDNNSALAKDVHAHSYVQINFDKESSKLTDSSKVAIDQLITKALLSGKIDELLVLSWSDYDYPNTEKKELSRSQEDLAAKRNSSIEDYIDQSRDLDVDTYNMAERPNYMFSWINSSDSRVKQSFQKSEIGESNEIVANSSKASHAVILVKLE